MQSLQARGENGSALKFFNKNRNERQSSALFLKKGRDELLIAKKCLVVRELVAWREKAMQQLDPQKIME